KIETMRSALINLNYNLGFEISRSEIGNIFNSTNEFIAFYDNKANNYCMVMLPISKRDKGKRKKTEPVHTFLIYKSGKVMQSSPDTELSYHAYIKFMNIIMSNTERIRLDYSIYQQKEYYDDILRQIGLDTQTPLALESFYGIGDINYIVPEFVTV